MTSETCSGRTGRLLSWFGGFALLALVGGSVALLLVVKERVQVTIASDAATGRGGQPAPWAAVSDEVGAVRADLRAFAGSLGPSLEQLAEALDAAADARVAPLRQELTALQAAAQSSERRASTDQQELAALRQEVAALRNELAALRALPPPPAPSPVDPVPVATVPEVVVPIEPKATASSAAPSGSAADPVAAAPRRKGFLRFDLPSDAFAFDRRQRYALLPTLSRVGFDAKSTLHDFSGATARLEGELIANLAAPSDRPSGQIVVEAAALSTDLEARDEKMRDHLAVADHPQIRFTWTGFTDAVVDAQAQSVKGHATGDLTIRGVTRAIAIPVTVRVDAAKRVEIEGAVGIKMSDFGVAVPSQLGVISVEDEVKLWIALRARSLGAAGEEGK